MCNAFATLNAINVNGHVEKKNGLSYLSWAWAWQELKNRYPDSYYTIYENKDGLNYHTDGRTCWVKTGLTVVDGEGCSLEHIEYLPVMDNRNRSIELDKVTSFDVNKAIQRSLTKAAARHGLGLYIYAGEDLPEEEKQQAEPQPKPQSRSQYLEAWCTERGMTLEDFGEWFRQAKEKGLTPAGKMAEMTPADFNKTLAVVEGLRNGAA